MPRLSTAMVRSEGVTLVEMRVEAASRHQVRLAVRADGPVWPPRNVGPDVQWEDGTVSMPVNEGATGVGCATPAPQGSVETELVAAEPVDDGLPEGVAAWLERVEERVATAERVAGADDLESAAAVVASVGGLAAGRNPGGVAAACLYTAADEAGYDMTQSEVSDVADVSAVTVRNSYRELRD